MNSGPNRMTHALAKNRVNRFEICSVNFQPPTSLIGSS